MGLLITSFVLGCLALIAVSGGVMWARAMHRKLTQK